MTTNLKITISLSTLPTTMISPQFQMIKKKVLRLHIILIVHLTIVIVLHLTIQYKLPLQAHITLINQLKSLPQVLKRRKPSKPQYRQDYNLVNYHQ